MMTVQTNAARKPAAVSAEALMAALPHPALAIRDGGMIAYVNPAAEQFFDTSTALLQRQPLQAAIPFGSPVLALVEQARSNAQTVSEYGVELTTPRIGARLVDAHVSALNDGSGLVLLLLQERSIAQKMDRAMISRQAARSVSAMAAVLAHEIKNPLAGIRGAAQLIEQNAGEDDRVLTKLICTETDRIRALVDRMEIFSDVRPVKREPVNIHEVLDHVRRLADSSFARGVRIVAAFDPSLPPVMGERDRLIQVLLNLVKNAADAVDGFPDGEIQLLTAYRPGVHLTVGGARERVSLPLELCVRDNGAGIPPDVLPAIFEPFVTTKAKGTGLGLALVAKIVGDHGGVIECESEPRKTIFRIRLPIGRAAASAVPGA
jgi:two-component system, NtrC family, nitrogen regulation sensor histidine kinase GlnL